MLSIFVCEDNPSHLERISKYIKKFITVENLDIKVACCSTSPTEILDYLQFNKVAGLYFLDIDLSCDINGVDLAEAIRQKYDPRGFIVFVTSSSNSHLMATRRKVEMLDYIVKDSDNLEEEIRDCIRSAYKRALHEVPTPLQNKFAIKLSKDATISIRLSDILFFKTDKPHFLIVNYLDGDYSRNRVFRGKITETFENLDERFIKCGRDVIVNADRVLEVDRAELRVTFGNGAYVNINSDSVKQLMKFLSMRKD